MAIADRYVRCDGGRAAADKLSADSSFSPVKVGFHIPKYQSKILLSLTVLRYHIECSIMDSYLQPILKNFVD